MAYTITLESDQDPADWHDYGILTATWNGQPVTLIDMQRYNTLIQDLRQWNDVLQNAARTLTKATREAQIGQTFSTVPVRKETLRRMTARLRQFATRLKQLSSADC